MIVVILICIGAVLLSAPCLLLGALVAITVKRKPPRVRKPP